MLDEYGEPVDLKDQAAVEALAGRPVVMCVPVRREIAGHVVEAHGSQPMSNARVIVESWWTAAPIGGREPERQLVLSAQVRTDTSGNWRLASDYRWMPGILAADGFPFFVSGYCVHAPGYAPYTFDPWGSTSQTFSEPPTEVALGQDQGVDQSSSAGHSLCGIPLSPPLLDP